MFRWWEHHLVMMVFPFFVAAYGCMRLEAPRALIACLAASALYIGAIGHPLLAAWVDPHALPLHQGKFFAQLALFVVLEILIRRRHEDC